MTFVSICCEVPHVTCYSAQMSDFVIQSNSSNFKICFFFGSFANLLQNTKIDHCLGLLKACLKRMATRGWPFVVPEHMYGVSRVS